MTVRVTRLPSRNTTMLTGCGGMGLPIDIKTGEVNLDRIPTPEKVIAFAEEIMPVLHRECGRIEREPSSADLDVQLRVPVTA